MLDQRLEALAAKDAYTTEACKEKVGAHGARIVSDSVLIAHADALWHLYETSLRWDSMTRGSSGFPDCRSRLAEATARF